MSREKPLPSEQACTDVVTVFLVHQGKILLMKRSNRVRTYQGHWAAVSGYLESPDPLQQAYIELAEEVGLEEADVTLRQAGACLEVRDQARGRLWRVHPFLFSVKSPKKIRLDWEHTEMQWVSPQELGNFRTVPALAETLERVLADHGLDQ
ncbi:MAG: NUDIX pyrophosphatase [Deltaproteobacteria bacterium]|nr:NUDIX pyrophosphatase [Deltaproteobacteria bacterium]